jgi:hypothetical protein
MDGQISSTINLSGTMLGKRFVQTLLGLTIIVAVICVLTPGIELVSAYRMCRDQMLSFEGYGVWVLQRYRTSMDSSGEKRLTFIFDDGLNDAFCSVYRDSSGLHKHQREGIGVTLVECFPEPNDCPSGRFGVFP